MSGFTARISNAQERIWEITIPAGAGMHAFYRLAIHPLKEAAFRKACKLGSNVNLRDFGDIVESCYLMTPHTITPKISEAV